MTLSAKEFTKRALSIVESNTCRSVVIDAMKTRSEGCLSICDFPFTQSFLTADIILVGLTPGYSQLIQSIELFRSYAEEKSIKHSARSIPKTSTINEIQSQIYFSGQMRVNMFKMLAILGISSINTDRPSWVAETKLLETSEFLKIGYTSLFKGAVFWKDKNYTGYNPKISTSNLLMEEKSNTIKELSTYTNQNVLIVPMGRVVENYLNSELSLCRDSKKILLNGFPHPSSANGHRVTQFNNNKESLVQLFSNFLIEKRNETDSVD